MRCDCSCPGCGGRLVAKKGMVNSWHFAHEAVSMGNISCSETSLHWGAKRELLLSIGKEISLPSLVPYRWQNHSEERILSGIHARIHDAKEEVILAEVNRRVDMILDTSISDKGRGKNGFREVQRYVGRKTKLIVEIAVTNSKDTEYCYDIAKVGISAIEIQLTLDEIRQRMMKNRCGWRSALRFSMLSTNTGKRWLYHRNLGIPLAKVR